MNLVVRFLALTGILVLAALAASAQRPVVGTPVSRPASLAPARPVTQQSQERAKGGSDQGGRLTPSETNLRTTNTARPASQPATAGSAARTAPQRKPVQSVTKGYVKWMTIEQALERCKTERRKIFVDVYTDWCGWCRHMDSTTFVSASVARYLNEKYYPVKFNAEQTGDVYFRDKTYKFKSNGSRGHHELAAFWLNNKLSYPTVVFLDESQNLIQPVPGYQDAAKMEAIINYFGSDSHKRVPWETYERNFVPGQ
jgi:thioredoxin-related protein